MLRGGLLSHSRDQPAGKQESTTSQTNPRRLSRTQYPPDSSPVGRIETKREAAGWVSIRPIAVPTRLLNRRQPSAPSGVADVGSHRVSAYTVRAHC